VFTLDTRLRGIPVTPGQVISIFQSSNSPHLAIPGKQAGHSKAYVLGVRTASAFAMFVYLYLPEISDCAIYSSDQRIANVEDYREAESDAIAFVESMGFIVVNMNFRALGPADQEELIRSLPIFMRDPRLVVHSVSGAIGVRPNPTTALGRLLASF